ncbi:hypothetical protein [Mycoplasmopsis agalactiae]|uniref:hypothetical protein n=1 Tax=Mycoplasmopsis agalactiae TaxID=2110 RepID=UPI001F1FFDBC|nr:hypothetical protein [Mycoplasmopsis agalactiae]
MLQKFLKKNSEKPRTDRDMPGEKKETDKEKSNEEEPVPPVAPPANMPNDEPKNEMENNDSQESSELDEVAKSLKDILIFGAAEEDKADLMKLKADSSKYSLWYDKTKRNILLVEGKKSPFDKENTDVNKFVLFELKCSDKIKDPVQLVNDKKPTTKVKDDDGEHIGLSNELNFEISKKGNEEQFEITVKYKVGKFINKDEKPEVSRISNQSTLIIDLKK